MFRTTRVSWYQKDKTNSGFTEARDSEWQWQWHQLGHMQVWTLLQTDNHASTPPLSFLQAGCPSCRPTNSVKALKAKALKATFSNYLWQTSKLPRPCVTNERYIKVFNLLYSSPTELNSKYSSAVSTHTFPAEYGSYKGMSKSTNNYNQLPLRQNCQI